MGLFGRGKKKEQDLKSNQTSGCDCGGACTPPVETSGCDCGGACDSSESSDAKSARFIVLGACCKKSSETFENTKKAVSELGFSDEVVNIGDAMEIVNYGVMQTPAIVIEGKVVSYGKVLSVDKIKELIEKSGLIA